VLTARAYLGAGRTRAAVLPSNGQLTPLATTTTRTVATSVLPAQPSVPRTTPRPQLTRPCLTGAAEGCPEPPVVSRRSLHRWEVTGMPRRSGSRLRETTCRFPDCRCRSTSVLPAQPSVPRTARVTLPVGYWREPRSGLMRSGRPLPRRETPRVEADRLTSRKLDLVLNISVGDGCRPISCRPDRLVSAIGSLRSLFGCAPTCPLP
jgi:hypothetical protein